MEIPNSDSKDGKLVERQLGPTVEKFRAVTLKVSTIMHELSPPDALPDPTIDTVILCSKCNTDTKSAVVYVKSHA